MQNEKNQTKSFDEEGSEVSVQMGLRTADKYIDEIGILDQLSPADWRAFRDAEWALKHALKYVQKAKKRAEKINKEGSEVSAQMGFKVKNEGIKTMDYTISKIVNASTSKNCPCSRQWLTEKHTIWSADPADAKRFNTKEEARNFKETHRTGGSILGMK